MAGSTMFPRPGWTIELTAGKALKAPPEGISAASGKTGQVLTFSRRAALTQTNYLTTWRCRMAGNTSSFLIRGVYKITDKDGKVWWQPPRAL